MPVFHSFVKGLFGSYFNINFAGKNVRCIIVMPVYYKFQCVTCRYDAVPGGSGSTPSLSITDPVGDRLTQMDYFHNTRWQWIVPFQSPVILNALLR